MKKSCRFPSSIRRRSSALTSSGRMLVSRAPQAAGHGDVDARGVVERDRGDRAVVVGGTVADFSVEDGDRGELLDVVDRLAQRDRAAHAEPDDADFLRCAARALTHEICRSREVGIDDVVAQLRGDVAEGREVGGAVAGGCAEAGVEIGRDRYVAFLSEATDGIAELRVDPPDRLDDNDRRRGAAGVARRGVVRVERCGCRTGSAAARRQSRDRSRRRSGDGAFRSLRLARAPRRWCCRMRASSRRGRRRRGG